MSHLTDYSFKVIEANSCTTETKFFCRDEDCIIVDTLQISDVFNKEVGLCRQSDANDNALPNCYTHIHQSQTSPFISLAAVDNTNNVTSKAELTDTGVKLSSYNNFCCSFVNLTQDTMCVYSNCGPVNICAYNGIYFKPNIANCSEMCNVRMLIEPYQFGFEIQKCNCDTNVYCSGSWFHLTNNSLHDKIEDAATTKCSYINMDGSYSELSINDTDYDSYLTINKYNSTIFSTGSNTSTLYSDIHAEKSGDNCCITALNLEAIKDCYSGSLTLNENKIFFSYSSNDSTAHISLCCIIDEGLGVFYGNSTHDSNITINCGRTSIYGSTVIFCTTSTCQIGQNLIHNYLCSSGCIGLGTNSDFSSSYFLICKTGTNPRFYPQKISTYTGIICLPTGPLNSGTTHVYSDTNCYCVISGIIVCQL